jgi:hypothetical protein
VFLLLSLLFVGFAGLVVLMRRPLQLPGTAQPGAAQPGGH